MRKVIISSPILFPTIFKAHFGPDLNTEEVLARAATNSRYTPLQREAFRRAALDSRRYGSSPSSSDARASYMDRLMNHGPVFDPYAFWGDPTTVSSSIVSSLLAAAGVAQSNISKWAPALFSAAVRYKLNTPLRMMHFLSQVVHESDYLTTKGMKEYSSGAQYEYNRDLGNTRPGDGVKYKARGPIGLTGRANYQAFKDYSGVDVITNPDLIMQTQLGADSAAWYLSVLRKPSLKAMDRDDIVTVTKYVNGDAYGPYTQLNKRRAILDKMKSVINTYAPVAASDARSQMNVATKVAYSMGLPSSWFAQHTSSKYSPHSSGAGNSAKYPIVVPSPHVINARKAGSLGLF